VLKKLGTEYRARSGGIWSCGFPVTSTMIS